ncbi:HD domain-containing protein [Paenibacillus thermotolerans]|uniref:HD domain-containing protein n=1 Tax=Paenibacillus thermotolerans TaxID=3027807 RepID=UPI0030823ED9
MIDKAIRIAAIAHKDQSRKGSDVPYISHPFSVGMILAQEGCSDEVIAAGILHDTVEDTELTPDDIKRQFGQKVADIVMGCSEPDKSLSWEERKRHTLEALKAAPDEIRLVSCADKLQNVRSMIEDYSAIGEELWTKFKRGKEQQEWYYRGIIESLSHGKPFPLVEKLREEVDRLFAK